MIDHDFLCTCFEIFVDFYKNPTRESLQLFLDCGVTNQKILFTSGKIIYMDIDTIINILDSGKIPIELYRNYILIFIEKGLPTRLLNVYDPHCYCIFVNIQMRQQKVQESLSLPKELMSTILDYVTL